MKGEGPAWVSLLFYWIALYNVECFHLTTLKTDWKEQLFKQYGIQGDWADRVIQMEKQMLSWKTFLEITGSVLSVTPELVVEKEKEEGWKSASWDYNNIEKGRT